MSAKNLVRRGGFSLLISITSLTLVITLNSFLTFFQPVAQASEQPQVENAQWTAFRVATGTLRHPDVFEDKIVWSQYQACDYQGPYPAIGAQTTQEVTIPEERWDLCLYNLATNTLTTMHSGGNLDYPDLYGEWAAWDKNQYAGYVVAQNLTSGEEVRLSKAYMRRVSPQLYKDKLLYSPDGQHLYVYDLQAGDWQTIVTLAEPTGIGGQMFADLVVFTYPISGDYNIDGYDLQAQTTFTISARPGNELGPRIDDNKVVWRWNQDIYGYDLVAGEYLTITSDVHNQYYPYISNDLVVWRDDRYGEWDIYAYDLNTGQEWRVTQETDSTILDVEVWGDLIVWTRGGSDLLWVSSEVWAARLMDNFAYLPAVQR